ncbi:MAG: exodeoxyribonuclease VII large subunit, partial [Phycisphaerales bacterium]|nr:exodeoxyribonuclease VII large subunit [Phycisphaerales bacterium]
MRTRRMTGQLPFDPRRARGGRGPRPDSGPLTPSQVNDLVQGAIARHVPATLHVVGQIADLSRPQSGHLYFTLKDARGELRVVMWRSDAAKLKFDLHDGLEIIATGAIEVYAARGQYQLIARRLEPRGVGALELAFRQLREKLQAEGLFAAARKRAIPVRPARVALVTSPSGAAIHDILHTAKRRYRLTEFLVFPARVQGDGAAEEVAAGVRRVSRVAGALGGVDAIIVARGGGSLEDLWPFNEEIVARAIAESEIPVISAVGHEVDVTISDLVADARAATPTAAAEMVTPDMRAILTTLADQRRRVARVAGHALDRAALRLRAVERLDMIAQPLRGVAELR